MTLIHAIPLTKLAHATKLLGATALLLLVTLATGCESTPRVTPTMTFDEAIRAGDAQQVRAHLRSMDQDRFPRPSRGAMMIAVSYGHLEVVEILLDAGARLTTPARNMETPLHLASCRGHVEVMRLLIDRGTPVDVPDQHFKTPLHWAAECGQTDAVALLLDRGADINAVSEFGTPLALARNKGHDQVITLLETRGGRGG